MEHTILSVALKSREDFQLINQYIKLKGYTTEFKIVWGFIKDYYARDSGASSVDRNVFAEILRATVPNEKHAEKFLAFADEAASLDVSGANVKEVVFQAKLSEVRIELAGALVGGKDHDALLEEYQALRKHSSLEEMLSNNMEVYTSDDLAGMLEADARREGVVPIYPKALGDRLDGGLQGSDHMVIAARPEMGKTALVLTIAGGAAASGFRVLVVNNEERINRLMLRQVSNLTGLTTAQIRADTDAAVRKARQLGFDNITFAALSPGSVDEVDRLVEKHEPHIAIVDQIRNYIMKTENKTTLLEEAAKGNRNIAKRHNIAVVSITQAGDSAEGQSVVGMSDVDGSKTGIPGANDVQLGVGANEMQKEQNVRIMTLSKNKIGGDHSSFPVRIKPEISKYTSMST